MAWMAEFVLCVRVVTLCWPNAVRGQLRIVTDFLTMRQLSVKRLGSEKNTRKHSPTRTTRILQITDIGSEKKGKRWGGGQAYL